MVTVVLPTCNRYEVAAENVRNIVQQAYSPLEVIVCDDSDGDYFHRGSKNFRVNLSKLPGVRYLYCARFDVDGKKDYGLARARNFGTLEAEGEFMVFLDDRITPADPGMVDAFVSRLRGSAKVWLFGDKGAQKQSFVENCSAIRRSELVDAGLFCERIDQYGGMSRELIGRFGRQGFTFAYVPEAKATQVCKSTGWDKKEGQIGQMKAVLRKLWERT